MSGAMLGLALLLSGTGAVPDAAIESVPPPREVAASQRRLLDSRALVVRRAGQVVMRVWFRAAIPLRPPDAGAAGAPACRRIPEGTLAGALRFPAPFIDYRGQRLAAGTYTLRFAMQPDTGDHTDTAPHREFFLLSPAAADRAAGEIGVKALIELSSRVNDGRHPAVLLLWPERPAGAGPRVVDKGRGVWAAAVARPAAAGGRRETLAFAITIAGMWVP